MRTSRALAGFILLTVLAAISTLGDETGSYVLQSDRAGWRAPCPAQAFDGLIGPTNLRVIPRDGAWSFALDFERLGRDGAMVEAEPAGVAATGREAELHRGPVVPVTRRPPLGELESCRPRMR